MYVNYHLLLGLACFAFRAQKLYLTQRFDSIWCAFWGLNSKVHWRYILYQNQTLSFPYIQLKSIQPRATKVNMIAEHEWGLAPSKGWKFCSECPGGSFRVLSRECFYIVLHINTSLICHTKQNISVFLAFCDRNLSCIWTRARLK